MNQFGKRQPWIARGILWLTCAVTAMSGCNRQNPQPTAPADEPSLRAQLEAVRDGTSEAVLLADTTVQDRDMALFESIDGLDRLTELQIVRAQVTDDGLAHLRSTTGLLKVELLAARMGDEGLAALALCKRLTLLNVPGGLVTDRGLERLDLPELRVLNLHQTQITDAGLAHLTKLPKLELLRLGSPRITDKGMDHIAKLPGLRALHLMEVPITDAGLEPLKTMTWLETLYIDGGQVTDEGLGGLLKALPNLHFHKDQQHLYGDPGAHSHGDSAPI